MVAVGGGERRENRLLFDEDLDMLVCCLGGVPVGDKYCSTHNKFYANTQTTAHFCKDTYRTD